MALNNFSPNTKIESEKINANFEGLQDGSELAVTTANAVNIGGAWQTWAPTLGAGGSMTYTSTTVHFARYIQIGKVVIFHLRVTGTTGGTADNDLTFTLPITANETTVFGNGYTIGGLSTACVAIPIDADTASVREYASASWSLGTGRGYNITGVYEAS